MTPPPSRVLIVSLNELERYRQQPPPVTLQVHHMYVDIASGQVVQLVSLAAPGESVAVAPTGGGHQRYVPPSDLRTYVPLAAAASATAAPPPVHTGEPGCLELAGKVLAYMVLAIVIFFGLIFGFCALGGGRR